MQNNLFGYCVTEKTEATTTNRKLHVTASLDVGKGTPDKDWLNKRVTVSQINFDRYRFCDVMRSNAPTYPRGFGVVYGNERERQYGKYGIGRMSLEEAESISIIKPSFYLIGQYTQGVPCGDLKEDLSRLYPVMYGHYPSEVQLSFDGWANGTDKVWATEVLALSPNGSTYRPRVPGEALAYLLYQYNDMNRGLHPMDEYTAAWYDPRNRSIHLHAKGKPLYILNDRGTYYWSSVRQPDWQILEGHLELKTVR